MKTVRGVSVLVLTLNEEENIDHCLGSLSFSNDIVVLDSGSTDRTLEIAHRHGARVVSRQFDDWSSHQNWAVKNIRFQNPWVYYSDADEIVPTDLSEELKSTAQAEIQLPKHSAYRLRYRNYYMGRWIRHCGIYPTWVLRFFRPEKIRWERLVNPIPVVDGTIGHLSTHFEHHSFNKGLEHWFSKHNAYSTREAEETLASLTRGQFSLASLLAKNPASRRIALKELSMRLPARALQRFVYMYMIRRGYMDGREGLEYCVLLSIYEFMIELKVRELRRRHHGLAI